MSLLPQWLLGASLALLALPLSYIATSFVVERLERRGRWAWDMNKPHVRAVEPAGIGPVAAFYVVAMLFLLFFPSGPLLALSLAMLAISFFGLVDDVLALSKGQKFLIPLLAAIPLVVLKAASSTVLYIPFLGPVDLGLAYLFLYVPFAFTISANLTNILAGFNGVEAGMGAVMHLSVAFIALHLGLLEPFALSLAYAAALLGFLPFNAYPARAFPGDVLTMSTGALLAAEAVLYNLDWAMAILLLPYAVDALFKIRVGIPAHKVKGILRGKKLYSPHRVLGFAHFLMKSVGGIEEWRLSLLLILLQGTAGMLAIAFYLFFLPAFAPQPLT